jgi:hypothetical protein
MTSYLNTSRVLERRNLGRALKPADDRVNVNTGTKGVAADSRDHDDASNADLTLDDFGGRSDALGG